MSILFWIAVIYAVFYAMQTILYCFSSHIWSVNDQRKLICFVVCLIFISYFVVPDDTTDLYRYHAVVNWYKYGTTSIANIAIKSISDSSSTLYIHVLLLYIVSKLNNNSILQVIWECITYGCFAAVIQKYTKRYSIPANRIYTSIILFFGLTSYFTCVSNLRYPCLCVLFFYAVYLTIFEGKKYPIVVITIVGLGIHLSVFMLLLIWAVYLLSRKTNAYRLIVFWAALVNLFIFILEKIPIARLQYVGEKLYYYFNVYQEDLSFRLRLIFITLQILLLVGLYLIKKRNWNYLDENYKKYFYFLEVLLLFSLGSVLNDTMLKRTMILLGPCLLPYNAMVMPMFKNKNQIAGVSLVYGLGLNALYLVSLFTFFSFAV